MINVIPAGQALRLSALTLLYSHLPMGEREQQLAATLTAVARGQISLDHLLAAEADGTVVGAILAITHPGRAAFLWPPNVKAGQSQDDVADALLQATGRRLDDAGILFTQCMLQADDEVTRAILARNGFTERVELLFLGRPIQDPVPDVTTAIDSAGYSDELHDRFAHTIEQTYIGTHDCPMLSVIRGGAEALATYRSAEAFDPVWWRIYQVDGADIGVLLLGDSPDRDAWEVIYLGIVPQARGRGYGRSLLQDGLSRVRATGRDQMLLAVDKENSFAKKLYAELGFIQQGHSAVQLRLRKTPPSTSYSQPHR